MTNSNVDNIAVVGPSNTRDKALLIFNDIIQRAAASRQILGNLQLISVITTDLKSKTDAETDADLKKVLLEIADEISKCKIDLVQSPQKTYIIEAPPIYPTPVFNKSADNSQWQPPGNVRGKRKPWER